MSFIKHINQFNTAYHPDHMLFFTIQDKLDKLFILFVKKLIKTCFTLREHSKKTSVTVSEIKKAIKLVCPEKLLLNIFIEGDKAIYRPLIIQHTIVRTIFRNHFIKADKKTCLFLSGVVEYLLFEIISAAMAFCKVRTQAKDNIISVEDLTQVFESDEDLFDLFKNCGFRGFIPNTKFSISDSEFQEIISPDFRQNVLSTHYLQEIVETDMIQFLKKLKDSVDHFQSMKEINEKDVLFVYNNSKNDFTL